MRDRFFVLINLPNGKERCVPIDKSHLEVFGINENAVHYLNAAHKMVCGIEASQKHDLGHFGRAEAMCLDYRSPVGTLAMNQCLRWELLLHALGELHSINNHFGDGLIDRLE